VKYLVEQYDLTQVPMAGASSGSLVACLAACGVDPGLIVDEAYQLSIENDIWNRKFGLIGIWGGLIRGWLDKLLPDNAHKLVSGRLHVIIAKAPTLQLFEV
jgi:predicted acylesterase/phospholipase RssA